MRPRYFPLSTSLAIAAAIVAANHPLAAKAAPTYAHVVYVEYENQAFSTIFNQGNCPYIATFAQQGALFTNYYARTHPSQPNYLYAFSGANQGVWNTDNSAIDGGGSSNGTAPFTTPNLFAQLINSGRTFDAYSEALPSVGYTGDVWNVTSTPNSNGNSNGWYDTSSGGSGSDGYVEKHNPVVNWQGTGPNQVPASCNQPYGLALTGTTVYCPIASSGNSPTYAGYANLPTFSYVIPNEQDEMHSNTPQAGDAWLANNMNGYAQWAKANNSLVVFTFDEDNGSGASSAQGPIATFIVGAGIVPGVYNESANCFSLLRTFEDMYGLPYAGAAATATPITDIFATSGNTLTTTTWRVNSGSGNWNGAGNWSSGQYPNSNAYKVSLNLTATTGSSQTVNINVADARCEYLSFDPSGGAISSYTVSGANPLTIEAGSYVPYGSKLGAIVVPVGNTAANIISAALDISTSSDTAGLVIDNNGTGGLTISGSITYNASGGTQSRSLTVQGSGNTILSGAIDGGIVATLTKGGGGLLTLQGGATYTGATTVSGGKLTVSGAGTILNSSSIVVNGGNGSTFLLDNNTAGYVPNRLGSSVGITLNGGTFSYLGNNNVAGSETFGAVTLGPGASTVAISRGTNASYPAAITFGSGSTLSSLLSRTAGSGSMVDFAAQTSGQGGPGGSSGGGDRAVFGTASSSTMPAAWIVVNGHDFAGYSSTQGMYEMGSVAVTRSPDLGAAAANTNVLINGTAQTTLGAGKTINSLVVQSGSAQSSNLGGFTLNIANNAAGALDANGGIVVSGASDFAANGGYTISGGTLTSGVAGTNSELFTWIDSGTTTINAVIANIGGGTTSLALGGSGTLVLGGANTFSGGTFVNEGVLQLSNTAGLGPAGSALTIRAGGVLDIAGLALNGNNYSVSVSGSGTGGGAIINSGTAQLNALRAISLAGDTALGGANEWDLQSVSGGTATLAGNGFNLTKTGANRIAFAGQYGSSSVNTLVTGVQNINVNQGTLALTYNTTLDNATAGSIYINSGTALSVGNYGASPGVNILKPLVISGGTLQTDSAGSSGNATIAANISLNAMPYFGAVNGGSQNLPVATMAAANLYAQSGSTLTLSGVISDGAASNSLLLCGLGTVVIAGGSPNTYSGDTIVGNLATGNACVLNVQKSQGLGTGSVSVATGAALQLQGNVTLSSSMLSLSGTGSSGLGALQNISGNNVWNGNLSLAYGNLIQGNQGPDTYTAVNTSIMSNAGTLTINGNILGSTNGSNQFILGGAGNGVVNGVISGAQALIKTSTGTWTLSGSNTYTGATSVSQGTLALGPGGALANTTVTVGNGTSNNAALQINGNYTMSGTASLAISGGGSASGQGALGFSTAESGPSTLTLSGGMTVGGSAGYPALLNFNLGSGAVDTIAAGSLAVNGGGAVIGLNQLAGTSILPGTYNLITFGGGSGLGGLTFSSGTSETYNGDQFKLSYTSTAEQLSVIIPGPANAYWTGAQGTSWSALNGSSSTNWGSTAGGPDTNALPTANTNVFFTASGASNYTNTTLDNNFTINSLTFNANATGPFTISSGSSSAFALTIDGSSGITVNTGAGAATIGAPLVLGAAQTWTNNSSSLLAISGSSVSDGGNTLTLAGSGNTAISAAIGGIGGLADNSSGTVSLSGANTFSGQTQVSGTALLLANSGALQDRTYVGGVANGLAFRPGIGTFTLGGLSGSSGLTLSDTGGGAVTLQVGNNGTSSTYSGALSGMGGLAKTGSGLLALTGAATYHGATSVSQGTLALGAPGIPGSGGSLGNTAVTVGNGGSNNAVLLVNGNYTLGAGGGASLTVSGSASGQGTLGFNTAESGPSTLTLSGGMALGGSPGYPALLNFNVGNNAVDAITASGILTVNAGGAIVGLNQLSGTSLSGTGTYNLLTFSSSSGGGSITFPGGVTSEIFSGDSVKLQSTGSAEQLVVQSVSSTPLAAYWAGTSSASWNNTGNWVNASGAGVGLPGGGVSNVVFAASNASNYAGTTLDAAFSINGLTFSSSGAVGIGPGSSGTGSLTIAGTSGAGAIAVNAGAGAATISAPVTLGSSQTWTNNSSNLLTISGNVSNGGNTLALAGSGNTTISGVIGSGSGGVLAAGSGLVVLNNANTYTGATTVSGGTLTLSGGNGGASATSGVNVGTGAVLLLDNRTNNNATRVTTTAPVALNSGTLTYLGCNTVASSEQLGVLTVGLGVNTVAISRGTNSSDNAQLAFGSGNGVLSTDLVLNANGGMVNFTTAIPGQGGPGGSYTGTWVTTAPGDNIWFGASGSTDGAPSINDPSASIVVNGHAFAHYSNSRGMMEDTSNSQGNITNFAFELGAAPANANVVITGTVSATPCGSKTINDLMVQCPTAYTSTLTGTLNIMNNGDGSSGAEFDSNGGILVAGSGAFTPNGGYTISGGTITSGNSGTNSILYTWIDSSTTTINSMIADIGGGATTMLVKAGTGTLVLGGSNTYSRGTTLNGGVLNFANGTLPFSTSTPNIKFYGGTLQWATGNTQDVSAGIAPIASGYTAILDTNNNNVSFAAGLSGSGGVAKVGAGILTLAGSNTYSGGTTISAGVLMVGAINSLSPNSAVTVSGGTLDASGFPTVVASLNVASGGRLNVGLGNTLASSGTALLQGTLNVSGTGTLGNYPLVTYLSESGTFSSVTDPGLGSNYGLIYSSTAFSALHKAQVGTVTVTAVNPTVITGGTTSLTVNVANSAPASSDVLNFTASASGAGYGYSTTGSLTAAASGNFTVPDGFSSSSLAVGSYMGTVTVTGTNSALTGVALGSGGTATVTVNVLGHAAGSATVTAGDGFLAHAGATGLSAVVAVSNAAGMLSGLEVASVPSIGSGALSSGPATPYCVSAGSAQTYTATFNAGNTPGVLSNSVSFASVGDNQSLPGANALGSLSVSITGNVYSGQAEWTALSGSWGTTGNWKDTVGGGPSAAPGVLGYVTDTATFGTAVPSGTATVALDSAAPLLSNIVFSNSNASYVILQGAGTTGLTLTGTGGGSPAVVTVISGTHGIEAPILLDSNLVVSSSGSLTLDGGVSDGGIALALTLDGGGTLILSGSDGYSGGTTVNAGTLILTSSGALAGGTSLTIGAGATLIFDPSVAFGSVIASSESSQIKPVPEPGTLALLCVGALGLLAYAGRMRLPPPCNVHAGNRLTHENMQKIHHDN